MASTRHVCSIASFVVLMLVLSVDIGEGGVMGGFFKNDAHPGKCYINERLIIDDGGKGQGTESCGVYHCNDGKSGDTLFFTCISILPPPNCKWTSFVDMKPKYPLCCLRNFHCDDAKSEAEALKYQQSLKEDFSAKIEWHL